MTIQDLSIATMPGPVFLVCYAAAIAVALLAAWAWERWHEPPGNELAKLPWDSDPYFLAYLRGGAGEAVKTAVFALHVGERLVHETRTTRGAPAQVWFSRGAHAGRPPAHPIEAAVWDELDEAKSGVHLCEERALLDRVEEACAHYRARLEREGLLRPPEDVGEVGTAGVLAALGIGLLGGGKLWIALSHGRTNVAYLIMLGAAGIVTALRRARRGRLTAAGVRYLARRESAHEELRSWQSSDRSEAGWLTAFALFGATVVAGSAHADLGEAFKKPGAAGAGGAGCAGGCGGGCGGCGGCGG